MQKRSETLGATAPIDHVANAGDMVRDVKFDRSRLRAWSVSDGGLPPWHVRSRSGQALIKAELDAHHRQLWDQSPVGFVVVDAHGAILSSNERARELLIPTRSRSASTTLATCICEKDVKLFNSYLADVFQGAAAKSIDVQLETVMETNPRFVRVSALSVASLTAALTLFDVTELKQMELEKQRTEECVRQMQRLELMHTMSAGIAHDFKNIVQVIESYAAILSGQAQAANQSATIAAEIMSAAARGALLADRWLAFSRHGESVKQTVDISRFIEERLATVIHALPRSVRLESDCCAERIDCEIDPCLIEQVLINLCLNARDAMPRGGQVEVSVARAEFDSQASSHDLLPAGTYAKITVADNGMGIATEHLDRIFEPFFTTKASGAGTGLGLALVRGIISEHQGAIEVWSEEHVGSAFTVYLPALLDSRSESN